MSFENCIFPKEIFIEISSKSDLETCSRLKQCCKWLNENIKFVTGDGFILESPIVKTFLTECSNISDYDSADDELKDLGCDSDCSCECPACDRTRYHTNLCHSIIKCLK